MAPLRCNYCPADARFATVMGMQVTGSWSLRGNQFTATVSAMGQTQTIRATLQGETLVGQGNTPVRRIR